MNAEVELRMSDLVTWLRDRTADRDLEIVGCAPLVSGQSNLTYRLDSVGKRGARQSYLLRADPGVGLAPAYDLAAQFHLQRALAATAVPVPGVYWLESDLSVLGREFWVGEFVQVDAVPRLLPHDDPLAPARLQSFVETLTAVHNVDWRPLGIDRLVPTLRGEALQAVLARYLRRGADRLSGDDRRRFAAVLEWIDVNAPSHEARLTHGDCSLTNYLFRGARVVAVIDWELAALSDPLLDVAFYCSLIWRFREASEAERDAERREFLDRYGALAPYDAEQLAFWEVFVNCRNGLSWLAHPDVELAQAAFTAYRDRLISLLADVTT